MAYNADTVTPAKVKPKKGDLKIDLALHSKLKARAATEQRGLNELAEEHLWPAVGGQPKSDNAGASQPAGEGK